MEFLDLRKIMSPSLLREKKLKRGAPKETAERIESWGKEKAEKMFKMECVGLFLVEHLRTQKGIPDAVQRMGQVFEAVGSGLTYEQAFARVYGFSVKRAVAELVANFKRTAANPAGRVEGTRWEPYVPAAK